jgi:hypothetical protein
MFIVFYGKIDNSDRVNIMFLLALASHGFNVNVGDIIFQSIMFLVTICIPSVLILIFFVSVKRNKHLERIEEKLDRLLLDKENKNP